VLCCHENQIVISVVNPMHRPKMGWGLDPKYTVDALLVILLMLSVIFMQCKCDLYFLWALNFYSIAVTWFTVLGL